MTVRFADAVEHGDIDGIVALLTNDAWVTMPPEPYEYQGRNPIAAFLRDRAALRGADFRLVPTRTNGQPLEIFANVLVPTPDEPSDRTPVPPRTQRRRRSY